MKTMSYYLFLVVLAVAFAFIITFDVRAETDSISLSANIQTSLAMVLSSNNYPFGDLVANIPEKGSSGVDIDITTNASNGYTLGIDDAVAGSDSALLHTDLSTRIIDFSALIASPELWVSGTSRGLGFTVFAADTSKEAKWGTGTTYDDVNNKYAGVPQNATTVHTSTGYKTGSDTTSIAFILDVDPDQKAGAYSGSVTLTATAVLL